MTCVLAKLSRCDPQVGEFQGRGKLLGCWASCLICSMPGTAICSKTRHENRLSKEGHCCGIVITEHCRCLWRAHCSKTYFCCSMFVKKEKILLYFLRPLESNFWSFIVSSDFVTVHIMTEYEEEEDDDEEEEDEEEDL